MQHNITREIMNDSFMLANRLNNSLLRFKVFVSRKLGHRWSQIACVRFQSQSTRSTYRVRRRPLPQHI
jgi:hypothetical protein